MKISRRSTAKKTTNGANKQADGTSNGCHESSDTPGPSSKKIKLSSSEGASTSNDLPNETTTQNGNGFKNNIEQEQICIPHQLVRKKVYQFDSDEMYEFLIFHGVSFILCQKLLEKEFDGKKFESWSASNMSHFKSDLIKLLDTNVSINENEWKHLRAIKSRYEANPYANKNKIICDSVHGQIQMHPLLIKIIDTPQFQRMRCLSQLGILSFVYPSATHTRFEHSIGTAHLAGVMIKHLKESQPALKITLADELCVKIAGLCHDLGHGPFSHMFEEVMGHFDISFWKHEMSTRLLFDKMLRENKGLKEEFNCYGLFENEIELIKDMIFNEEFKKENNLTVDEKLTNLESLKKRGLDKSFLFEIVSNVRNNIDVDKFDYFSRDSSQLGLTNNFNYMRYISCTRVIKSNEKGKCNLNQICVRDKEISNLYELFHVRELLTRNAYKHEAGCSINAMVVEALVKADKFYKFTEIFKNNDLDRYERLNDQIFYEILYSNEPLLKESKEIIQRIVSRHLYKYISSVVLPPSMGVGYKREEIQHDFFSYLKENSSQKDNINYEDIIIELIKFNYGSGNKNPLENVRFYDKFKQNECFKIDKSQVSSMLLNVFEDNVVRVYSKVTDDEYINKIFKYFFDWCKLRNFNSPLYGTKKLI